MRSLIERGELAAVRKARGSRFSWRIDEASVATFLQRHGPYEARGVRSGAVLDRLERLEALREELRTQAPSSSTTETEDLRTRVVALEEHFAVSLDVADLQRRADDERAQVIAQLVEALATAERADALRRAALDRLASLASSLVQPSSARGLD